MKRIVTALLPFTFAITACPGSHPSELRPTFDVLEGLPGLPPEGDCGEDPDCCLLPENGWCRDVQTLAVRNVGNRDVTISAVRVAALADHEGEEVAFSKVALDLDEGATIGPDEQAVVRFRYTTPDGEAASAKIVIESDAEVNPTLEIEVHTLAYEPPAAPDAGPGDDAGSTDAGTGSTDAGATDAGSDDAGATDAGTEDAGTGDAGSTDAGDAGDAG